jgi:hypothetical protein
MAEFTPAGLLQPGTAAVEVHLRGSLTDYAILDQGDFDKLTADGVLTPWFVSQSQQNRVRAKLKSGKVAPVDILIMKPRNDQRVVYKDGDFTNLTRANLVLGHRPVIDVLIERQR